MARIRTFKPEFFRSPDTAKASPQARILFMAMWSWADDEGIGETNIYGLLGFAFPDSDELTAEDLQRLLKEVRGSFGVDFYECRGRYFYAVPSWDKHQKTERRANSRFPKPDDPDSLPDMRFGDSEDLRGNSSAPECGSVPGTGEPGNIGTGEAGGGVSGVRHQGNQSTEPPPRKCPKHAQLIDPPDCGSCRNYRIAFQAWEADQKQAEADELAEKRRQREQRENCPTCEGTGHVQADEDSVRPCPDCREESAHA